MIKYIVVLIITLSCVVFAQSESNTINNMQVKLDSLNILIKQRKDSYSSSYKTKIKERNQLKKQILISKYLYAGSKKYNAGIQLGGTELKFAGTMMLIGNITSIVGSIIAANGNKSGGYISVGGYALNIVGVVKLIYAGSKFEKTTGIK